MADKAGKPSNVPRKTSAKKSSDETRERSTPVCETVGRVASVQKKKVQVVQQGGCVLGIVQLLCVAVRFLLETGRQSAKKVGLA